MQFVSLPLYINKAPLQYTVTQTLYNRGTSVQQHYTNTGNLCSDVFLSSMLLRAIPETCLYATIINDIPQLTSLYHLTNRIQELAELCIRQWHSGRLIGYGRLLFVY